MNVLVYFAARPGEVVSHQELLAAFWRGTISSPNAVRKCVTELRHAFTNGGGEVAYIETISKRGYRLVAPVSPRFDVAATSVEKPKSIAVLRFRNGDGNADHDDLAEGLQAALIDGLLQMPNLFVVDRDGSLQHAIDDETAQEIGRALGVAHLLEGSVQQREDRLHVAVVLYRSRDGERVYTYDHDEPIAKVLQAQDKVIANVLTALEVHLDEKRAADMHRLGTQNVDAYLAALEGDAFHMRLDLKSMRYAVERFRVAISLDPGFEFAYRLLAWTLEGLHRFTSSEAQRRLLREELARLREEVKHLPDNSDALSTIDICERNMNTGSRRDLEVAARTAIQKESTPYRAFSEYFQYADLLKNGHLFREASQFVDLYARFDKEETALHIQRTQLAALTLGPQRAIPLEKKTLTLFQNDLGGLSSLATNLALLGEYREAEAYLTRLEVNDHQGIWAYAIRLRVAALRGDLPARSEQLAAALDDPRVTDYLRGVTHLIVGDVESGVAAWRRSLGTNNPTGARAFRYAMYAESCYTATVVDDPRYQEVLDEIGIGRQWTAYLREKVAELAPITGIEPGDPTPQRVYPR